MWRSSMEAEAAKLLILFIVSTCCCWSSASASRNSGALAGKLEPCTNEGEDVPVNTIEAMECYKCKCINNFVVCEEDCPYVDDCYMLERKDGCCEKCKDCEYKGASYESGTEWTADNDPCSLLKCVAGVITVSALQCFTPCANPVPARPGQCCPTCDGCFLNGQHFENSDGSSAATELLLAEDPCLKCSCTNSSLICAKSACPILHCPPSKRLVLPGECCPRCNEKRTIIRPPLNYCLIEKGFHRNGVLFQHEETHFLHALKYTPAVELTVGSNSTDMPHSHPANYPTLNAQCTASHNCTCNNGTAICRKLTCPVLECALELQLAPSNATSCCALCPPPVAPGNAGEADGLAEPKGCRLDGREYAANATWTVGPCKSCRCVVGEVRCVSTSCPRLKCKANESPVDVPGQCCRQCEEAAGICTVFGDPHYRTFDGRFYSFMGSCKYLLTGDCENNTFTIRVTNEDRHTKSSAWTKTVTLRLGDTKVNLGQKMRVKVNGSRVHPPYRTSLGTHWLAVTNTSDGIHVTTGLGVQLLWDGNSFLQVSAAAARFKNRGLCGLCGNYNGVWRDDLMSRQGHNYSDAVWRFGNSWRVGGARVCARQHENLAHVPECHRSRTVPAVCQQLVDTEVFAACTDHLNPHYYVESCKDDMCECPTHKCYCDSFAAYARECKRQGVVLGSWKQQVGCDAAALVAMAAQSAAQVATAAAQQLAVAAAPAAVAPEESGEVATVAAVAVAAARHPAKHGRQRLHGKKHHQQLLQQHHQQQQQHSLTALTAVADAEALLQRRKFGEDFLSKHIPKTFLMTQKTGRTKLPIH